MSTLRQEGSELRPDDRQLHTQLRQSEARDVASALTSGALSPTQKDIADSPRLEGLLKQLLQGRQQ
jgi:hypothetical protein